QDSCSLASDGSMFGTCLTAAECSNQGGSADGSCASGFGACCSFTLSGCGGTVTKVKLYFIVHLGIENCDLTNNAEFPGSAAPSQNCVFNFDRIGNAAGVALHGDCLDSGDSLMLTSQQWPIPLSHVDRSLDNTVSVGRSRFHRELKR
ncbi:hypothetical protein TCAL_16185, partial [Tigriopus californicus]